MGSKTKIDWCDSTWNPVTGCLHCCEYCYARRIAERFGRATIAVCGEDGYAEYGGMTCADGNLHELEYPYEDYGKGCTAPYPFEFDPTFHRYKLDEPQRWKKPRNIFVCSMADLFGEWVPDEWIKQVFEACEAAPQHRYLFLTKNPKRYVHLYEKGIMRTNRSFWYGSTATRSNEPFFYCRIPDDNPNTFCSIEPILEPFVAVPEIIRKLDWVIVGAETGNRKKKIVPQKEWIEEIADECKRCRVPIFMKESLRGLMGAEFRQELPWEV